MAELSATSGVPVATIKYYVREGLLPQGERTSRTQATYGDDHVRRLRVIRALVDAGVGISGAKSVLTALDDPPGEATDLLAVAHEAIAPFEGTPSDAAMAEATD
ncbi:MAG: MerR family transcriptional regulator, partial [Pseudoclavibacter sp.]